MLKKISVAALAGLLALPGVAMAGGGASDLEAKIAELTRQLEALKSQMSEMKDQQEEKFDEIDEKAESWDLASRIHLSGDFRARLDYNSADTPEHYTAKPVAQAMVWATSNSNSSWDPFYSNDVAGVKAIAQAMLPKTAAYRKTNFDPIIQNYMASGNPTHAASRYDNDTLWTNRLRINMRVKATENVEFKGRLAMYKAWGMQNSPVNYTLTDGPYLLSSFTDMDGATTRQPGDSVLRVDRAFINWNNIGDMPIWFSIGRRPTTDGPPSQLRLGADQRLATPTAVMDYAFDGFSLGYAYSSLFGLEKALGMDDWPGRVRLCYGRGFDSGPTDHGNGLNDVDFAGLSWDIYKKGDRFITLQSFGAFNMFNVPDGVTFENPLEMAFIAESSSLVAGSQVNYQNTDPLTTSTYMNGTLDRANLGNIFHTSAVYMDKYQDLNYFFLFGWSKTDAQGVDEMGVSLLGSWWEQPKNRDGYCFYTGVRYDLPDYDLKLGLEYNYGTQYWIGFTPAHDDIYASKLATRGHVWEVYGIWNIPSGEAVSKYGKAFMRLGYQHYEYDYTGSGFWLGAPADIDDLKNDPFTAQFYTPVDSMDNVYLTLEAWF